MRTDRDKIEKSDIIDASLGLWKSLTRLGLTEFIVGTTTNKITVFDNSTKQRIELFEKLVPSSWEGYLVDIKYAK